MSKRQDTMWLELIGDSRRSYVAWCDEVDGEGAWVGQDGRTSLDDLKKKLEQAKRNRTSEGWSFFEYLAVEIAAKKWVTADPDTVTMDIAGFSFESSSIAKRFFAAMKAAQKSARSDYDSDAPWPEWAKQARAAGWKAPKGWKP